MADITLINGAAEPIATSVAAGTVGELRSELGLTASAVISVDGHKASDSLTLSNGALVSALSTDKAGG